jgi:hypothetical protein
MGVAARADVDVLALSVKREPQHVASGSAVGILVIHGREDAKVPITAGPPRRGVGSLDRSLGQSAHELLLESEVEQHHRQ